MFPLLCGTDSHRLCMTHRVGNSFCLNFGVHAAKLRVISALQREGSSFRVSLSEISGSKQLLHLPWEDNEFPCGLPKKCAAQIAEELQHPVLTLVFFLQHVSDGECPWPHCRKGMEISLPAYRSKWVVWECDPEKLLHSSLQWFSWRHFGCREISMQYLFDKNWRKSVCWFYRSIILKHSCIAGAHQLKWKSMAHSPNKGKVGSVPVCRPLVICKFAHRSSECLTETVLTMLDSFCTK